MAELMGHGKALTSYRNRAVNEGDRSLADTGVETCYLLSKRLKRDRKAGKILNEAFKVVRKGIVIEIPEFSNLASESLAF